ncbi:hypothetical protein ACWCY6_38215 [Streptomyces sp. 900105755]
MHGRVDAGGEQGADDQGCLFRREVAPVRGGPDPCAEAVLTVGLTAGTNTLKFSNSSSWAPDIDYVEVAPVNG